MVGRVRKEGRRESSRVEERETMRMCAAANGKLSAQREGDETEDRRKERKTREKQTVCMCVCVRMGKPRQGQDIKCA